MASIRKKRRPRQRSSKLRPRSAEQFFALPAKLQDRINLVSHVVSRMRSEGLTLQQASREYGIDPRSVLRLGGSALRKRPNGRYAAKSRDNRLRILSAPTAQGLAEIATRDSRVASQIAEYWDAVQWFLATGDGSALRPFRGKTILTGDGTRVPFLTDLDELERLGSAGVLSFESIYAKAG